MSISMVRKKPDRQELLAVGTSLVMIAMASFSGFLSHLNLGEMDFSIVILFVLGGVGGVLGETSLAEQLPGQRLSKLFAGFVMMAGISLIYMNA